MDAGRRCLAAVGDGETALTRGEFSLLNEPARAPGRAVDRDTLSRAVFYRAREYEDRSLDILVARFRKRLAAAGLAEGIRSVRGTGYMLDVPRPGERPDIGHTDVPEEGQPAFPRP